MGNLSKLNNSEPTQPNDGSVVNFPEEDEGHPSVFTTQNRSEDR